MSPVSSVTESSLSDVTILLSARVDVVGERPLVPYDPSRDERSRAWSGKGVVGVRVPLPFPSPEPGPRLLGTRLHVRPDSGQTRVVSVEVTPVVGSSPLRGGLGRGGGISKTRVTPDRTPEPDCPSPDRPSPDRPSPSGDVRRCGSLEGVRSKEVYFSRILPVLSVCSSPSLVSDCSHPSFPPPRQSKKPPLSFLILGCSTNMLC